LKKHKKEHTKKINKFKSNWLIISPIMCLELVADLIRWQSWEYKEISWENTFTKLLEI